jgi:hypothetical protein
MGFTDLMTGGPSGLLPRFPEIAEARLTCDCRGCAFLNPVYWPVCKAKLGTECDG